MPPKGDNSDDQRGKMQEIENLGTGDESVKAKILIVKWRKVNCQQEPSIVLKMGNFYTLKQQWRKLLCFSVV